MDNFLVAAFRRRSGSCGTSVEEDRASPYYIKKARYSFTEDQKKTLRKAFQNDPYPTSVAIERLANDMDLSSKTVINWFHNHRMRSKQQNRDENGKRLNGIYIKAEPSESNSPDNTQFACHNSYTTDSQKSSPASIATSPGSTQSQSSPSPATQTNATSQPGTSAVQPQQHVNNMNTSRKRKNANPKYVSAGAVLDKHNNSSGEECGSETADDQEEIDVTGDAETTARSPERDGTESDREEMSASKVARLETQVWEMEREKCLEKLESRVQQTDNSEWAF